MSFKRSENIDIRLSPPSRLQTKSYILTIGDICRDSSRLFTCLAINPAQPQEDALNHLMARISRTTPCKNK
ncbi:hypothetical protein RRG08_055499 [Elysia crispata]|uniref:Uncharacterized protein n=1 Tax=Elysia crispata TaxID=231223 RepID=A0AAE0YHD2_9GAST|nr:hypothetical protein RRG08_055499 [Elysia crispata]